MRVLLTFNKPISLSVRVGEPGLDAARLILVIVASSLLVGLFEEGLYDFGLVKGPEDKGAEEDQLAKGQ
jgi:hypothetical protein